jgi:carboxyl-terminal processing protease
LQVHSSVTVVKKRSPRQHLLAPAGILASVLVGQAVAGDDVPPDYPALGREVVEIVREHFLDPERATAWAEDHGAYAAGVRDGKTFASRTNGVLSRLETSHTAYYPRGSATYWGLLSIFGNSLDIEKVAYDSIGADIEHRHFVRRVLAGGPAEEAGLLRGDRIIAVDGRPFRPIDAFEGKAGTPVTLTIERVAGGGTRELTVIPQNIDPKQEWLTAQDRGSRIVSRDGVAVAYVPMLWCVGEEVTSLMQEMIAQRFREVNALILDFRDGWGGCNPDFLNFFNTAPPVLTLIDREGEPRSFDPQWRKPLFVLINSGTRSGKEVVAHAVRQRKIGTLVGRRTAGFVVGGRPFLLSDRSLLYVAVMDALVDGERLEGVGVPPDVVVDDRLDYAAGADPQLERAIAAAVEQCRRSGDVSYSGVERGRVE